MESVLKGFSNRELALFIWISLFFVLLLLKGGGSSFWKLLKGFFDPRIFPITLAVVCYTISMVFVLHKIGLWNTEMVKDTVYWFFGTAIVLLMNSGKIHQIEYFKGVLKSTFKATLFLELLGHLYTFSLPVELLFMPFLLLIVLLKAYVEVKKNEAMVEKYLNRIMALIGVCSLVLVVYGVIHDFRTLWNVENLKSLAIIPILTIFYLPLLYLIALYESYELLFVWVNFFRKDAEQTRKIKWVFFRVAKLNLNLVSYFEKNSYRLKAYTPVELEIFLKRFYSMNHPKLKASLLMQAR